MSNAVNVEIVDYTINVRMEGIGSGVTLLSELTDVNISGLASGEILKYNGTSWVNQTLTEAGVASLIHTHAASDITDFDTEVANNSAVTANTAKVGFTDELAQDAIGTILSNEFTYNDAAPSISLNYANISHTSLQNIGTNTHAQIDTHIANTSNPHSVTKTQIGLSNLTNDAQLKIASNLSDLNNVATARTNLGLVAGGAGDIWVEKAGDTMTGDLIFSGSQKIIGGSGTTSDLTLQTTSGVGATGADMHFLVGNNGNTEAMTILNSGFVGFGTTSPLMKVTIDLGLSESGAFLIRTVGANTNHFVMEDSNAADASTPFGYFRMADGKLTMGNANRNPATGLTTGSTDRFTIDSTGNVGIGTTAPAGKLEVLGASAAIFTRTVAGASAPDSAIQIGLSETTATVGGGPSFLLFGNNSAGTKSFTGRISSVWENVTAGSEAAGITFSTRANTGDTTASTERMRITSGGNVGIGTTAPKATLDIVHTNNAAGGIRMQDNLTDATTKVARVKVGHYTNAEEPVTAMLIFSTSVSNEINYGGGSGVENSATRLNFYAAPTTTTTTGTIHMYLINSGLYINDLGNDFDTKIKSDNYEAFFVDASNDATYIMNNASGKVSFFGVTPVTRQTELTDELTTITFTAPTPDYAIQALTNVGGYGFVTADEGHTVLSVIANLQTRVNELETKLVTYGLLIDAD